MPQQVDVSGSEVVVSSTTRITTLLLLPLLPRVGVNEVSDGCDGAETNCLPACSFVCLRQRECDGDVDDCSSRSSCKYSIYCTPTTNHHHHHHKTTIS